MQKRGRTFSKFSALRTRDAELKGLRVKAKVAVELMYKGVSLGKAYEIDLLVEEEVIVENKSTDGLAPIFTFQVITYLKLYNKILATRSIRVFEGGVPTRHLLLPLP